MTRTDHAGTFLAFSLALIVAPAICLADGSGFTHVCSWAAFDAGAQGIGNDPDGYAGGAFDGRYVYFAPYHNGTSHHGEVLRHDGTADFDSPAAWMTFDPAAHGVGSNPTGFNGAVFDGRYVYFVPFQNANGYHGEVLRYDTTGDFANVASWAAFDPGSNGVGADPDGFIGGTFDGRYVYFAPYHNGVGQHGEVLRFDTTGGFGDTAAWITYDAGAQGVGSKWGYAGALFDGRYVYFVPNCSDDTTHHAEVRRYDTTGDFTDAASWAAYDPGDHGVGYDPDGYVGAAFDGRYVYFAPNWREYAYHGEVLRYDTTGDLDAAISWATFDPGDNGLGTRLDGYLDAVFDGRFVYFVPCRNNANYHNNVLRFDPVGEFTDIAAWTTFNPRINGPATNRGYIGAVFDGRHIYFAPGRWNNSHGEALRFDTATCPGDIDHDGQIGLADLAQLLGRYGITSGATCADGDIDGSGGVDLGDLAELLGAYGNMCD